MEEMLEQACRALSANDAAELESLARVASAYRAVPPGSNLDRVERIAHVLNAQLNAAAAHLTIRSRMAQTKAAMQTRDTTWAR